MARAPLREALRVQSQLERLLALPQLGRGFVASAEAGLIGYLLGVYGYGERSHYELLDKPLAPR